MALWRIVVKNSGNAACKDKRQRLEKGMFIETSTMSSTPPIGITREQPMLAQLFMNKYGIEIWITIKINKRTGKPTDFLQKCRLSVG